MKTQTKRTHLYLSVLILNILYLLLGTTFVWSSPVLMKLDLTEDEGSTVASMLSLGSVLGPFVSGGLLDTLGRKYTVALSMVMETASYLTLTFGSGVTPLSVGRFLGGVACGMALSTLPMYIAEISEDSTRGFLNTLNQISICLGCLLMYTTGPFLKYADLHYIMVGICAFFFLLFPLLPQSPYSLVMKNKINEARETLTWLREGSPESSVERELQLIQTTVQKSKEETGSIKELFTSRGNRRALTICCMLLFFQQVSGASVLVFYTEKIFYMTGTNLSSSACSIIIGGIMTASSVISPVAVKQFGYKSPMIVSAAGMALGMGSLGIFFLLKIKQFDVDSLNWLPLLSVITYSLFFNAGLANIPWALTGELFPSNIKPAATTVIASSCGLVAFLTTKLFPALTALIGIEFVFIGCSLTCCLAIVFIALIVKNTCGLSFIEIQEILNGQSSKKGNLNQPS